MDTDVERLRRRVAGEDRAALEELFGRHYASVYRTACTLVCDEVDAGDVAQATFLKALRAWRDVPPTQSVRAWLLAIAINEVRQLARGRRRRRTDPLAEACLADPDDGPAEAAARREFERALDDAVRALPPRLAEPLVLHYHEALPFAAVAEILALPKSTVQTRIAQAVGRLRRRFRRRGHAALLPLLDLRLDGGPGTAAGAGGATLATLTTLGTLSTMNAKQTAVAVLAILVLGLGGVLAWYAGDPAAAPEQPAAPRTTAAAPSHPRERAATEPLDEGRDAPVRRTAAADAGALVFGRVVDGTSGAAIAGATVSLFDFATARATTVATGADGGYAFEATRGSANVFHLAIEKAGAGRLVANEVRAAATPRRDELFAGLAIRGRVVEGGERRPVPDYRIAAVRLPFQSDAEWDTVAALHRQAVPRPRQIDRALDVANARGAFCLRDLQPGRYALLVDAPGRQPWFYNGGGRSYDRFAGVDAAREGTAADVEIVLPPQGVAFVDVVDRETGLPLRDARVSACLGVDRASFAFATGTADAAVPHRRRVPVALDDRGRIDSLVVAVTAPDRAPGRFSFGGQADGTLFTFALGRPAAVHGTVRGDDGAPVRGAVVLVERAYDEGLTGSACTDANGRYEIGGLDAPSASTLRCLLPGLVRVLATVPLGLRDGEVRQVDVGAGGADAGAAGDAGRLEGTVRVAGRPQRDASVIVRGVATATDVRCSTRDDGAFAFVGMPPGRYELIAAASDGDRSMRAERLVELGVAPVRLDFDFAHRITGTVRVVGAGQSVDEPLDGMVVARRVGVEGASDHGDVGPDGRFELLVAERGPYELSYDGGEDWAVVLRPIVDVRDAAAPPPVEVQIARDPLDGRIELRITDAASGRPVSGSLTMRRGQSTGAGVFEDGRYVDERAGLGRHVFTVFTTEHRPATVDVEVTPFATRIVRDVALHPARGVAITEVEPAGAGHRAGLRVGDRLRRCAGREIRSIAALRDAVAAARGVVEIVVARDGVESTQAADAGRLGIQVENVP